VRRARDTYLRHPWRWGGAQGAVTAIGIVVALGISGRALSDALPLGVGAGVVLACALGLFLRLQR
jgi:hypothetical protein